MKYDANILEAPFHNEAHAMKEVWTRLIHVRENRGKVFMPADDFGVVGRCFGRREKWGFDEAVLDSCSNLAKFRRVD